LFSEDGNNDVPLELVKGAVYGGARRGGGEESIMEDEYDHYTLYSCMK
jgi:hypothetical protein